MSSISCRPGFVCGPLVADLPVAGLRDDLLCHHRGFGRHGGHLQRCRRSKGPEFLAPNGGFLIGKLFELKMLKLFGVCLSFAELVFMDVLAFVGRLQLATKTILEGFVATQNRAIINRNTHEQSRSSNIKRCNISGVNG